MKHRLYYNKIKKSKWGSVKNFKRFSNFYLGLFFIFSPYVILTYGQFIRAFTRYWADEFFNSVFMQYFIGGSKISITKYDRLKFIIYSKNFFKFFYFYDIYSKKLSLDMNKKKRMPFFLAKFNKSFVFESFFFKIFFKSRSLKFSSVYSLNLSFLKLSCKLLSFKRKILKKIYPILKILMFFFLNIIFSNFKILLKFNN